ncbi:MAG: Ig-like domain-containing protein [Planctomycetaceae bacterium]|nr:Ig-like domain-containing protein [Planctomycetaceae bacterium]
MKHYIYFLVILLCVAGCSGPNELAGLSPVTITVVNGDKPVPNVRVLLSETGGGNHTWTSSGTTDARGVAVISSLLHTTSKKGAKPGTYKVLLTHTVSLPEELKMTEAEAEGTANPLLQEKRQEYIVKNTVVSQKFGDVEKTPAELTVKENIPAELIVDVAK